MKRTKCTILLILSLFLYSVPSLWALDSLENPQPALPDASGIKIVPEAGFQQPVNPVSGTNQGGDPLFLPETPADRAAEKSLRPHTAAGSVFWLILILWGIHKCSMIAKREETSSKCVYSLMLTLVGFGGVQLYQLLDFQTRIPWIGSVLVCFFVFVLGIAAVVLAIVGLAEYGEKFYTQGRKQAIWSIVLSVFMIGTIFIGFVIGVSGGNGDGSNQFTFAGFSEDRKYDIYESGYYRYRVDLTRTEWTQWQTLKQDYPAAETGGLLDEGYGFFVMPFAYNDNRPGDEAVLTVLLKSAGLDYPGRDIGPLQPVTSKGMTGYTFTSGEINEGVHYRNRHWFLKDDDRAFLISVWCGEGYRDPDVKSKEVFDRITIFPSSGAKRILRTASQLPVGYQQVLSKHYNQIGLYYYRAKSYSRAISYFEDAFTIFPEKSVYLKNAMRGFFELNQNAEAIAYYDKYVVGFAADPDLKLWKAWFLKELDRNEEAVALYGDIFNQGYKNDDDFVIYIDVLEKTAQPDEIDAAFSRYLKDGGSHAIYIKQAEVLYGRGEYTQSNELLEKISRNNPFSPETAYRMIWNYYAMEQYHKVIEICDLIETNGYESADSCFYRAKAQYGLKWYRKAKTSFERVLDFNAQDEDAMEYIRHISGLIGEGDNSTIREEISPVPLSDPLVSGMAKLDKNIHTSGYDSEYIYRIKGFDFQPGKKSTYTHYWKIAVNNESGVNRFSTLTLTFNPLYEKMFVNSLIVRNQEGKIVSSGDRSDYYLVDSAESGMATHEQTLNMPVPNLLSGYTIELIATVESLNPPESFFMTRHILFSSRPVHLAGIFYRGDSSAIKYKSLNGAPEPVKDKTGLTWMMTHPRIYKWEPRIAPYYTFLPMIWISENSVGWPGAGEEYLDQIDHKLALDEETRSLAGQITRGLTTRNDKIAGLASYVQSTYTYKPIEFGRRARIPNSARETIARKYGDCKDHAVLLQQLLRAAAIDSHLVLISTEYPGDPLTPTIDQFNHMINYVPLPDGGIFIDTTDKSLAMGRYLPVGLAGHYALILDPENIRLRKLEDYQKGSCQVTSVTTLSIEEKHAINLKNRITFTGYAASFMRENLKNVEPSEYLEWGRSIMSSHLPWVDTESISVQHLFENDKDLIIDNVVKVNNQCNQIDNKIITQIPTIWELYYFSAKTVGDRQTPFYISYPFVFDSTFILDIPEGYTARVGDASVLNERSSFGSWGTDISQNKQKMVVHFKADLNAGYFEKETYGGYQKTLENAIRSVKQTIQLEPASGKPVYISSQGSISGK